MAVDPKKYRQLQHGMGRQAALALANEATPVTPPGAITSVVAAGGTPTKAEYDALRADVIATRTALTALLTSLQNGNVIG